MNEGDDPSCRFRIDMGLMEVKESKNYLIETVGWVISPIRIKPSTTRPPARPLSARIPGTWVAACYPARPCLSRFPFGHFGLVRPP